MRKLYIFLTLVLALSIFACDNLQLPKAVEVKWSPNFRFSADINMSNFFHDAVRDKIDENRNSLSVLDCINNSLTTQTYIFYQSVNAFPSGINFSSISSNVKDAVDAAESQGKTYVHNADIPLYTGSVTITTPNLNNITDLDGFEIDSGNVKSKVYISSARTALFDLVTVEFSIDGAPSYLNNSSSPSACAAIVAGGGTDYTGTDLPPGGKEIELVPAGGTVTIPVEAYIKAGTPITSSIFTETINANDVTTELAIWFPLTFSAGPGGAHIDLPSFISEDEDLFARSSPDDSDLLEIVENLSISIKLSGNPFTSAYLNAASGSITFPPTPIAGNVLTFNITEGTMNDINNPANFPFAPALSVHFPAGARLRIPRNLELVATEFAVMASINHRIEF
jgi:hypothetical protein